MIMPQRMIPLLFVAALCFFGMAFFSIFINSRADDITQVTTIGNATPAVDSVTTAVASAGTDQTALTLIEGDTRRVYIYGTASDNNGCSEIDQVSQYAISLHRSDMSSTCAADNNNCYLVADANLTLGACTANSTSISYEGYVDVAYYTDPTDVGSPQSSLNWQTTVAVEDDYGARSSTADSLEVNSLIAFTLTDAVQYGSVDHGEISSVQSLLFTNTGNRALDAHQSASGDMVCNNGAGSVIPVGNVHVDRGADFVYAQGQALTSEAQTVTLELDQRTNDTRASTKNLYFRIQIPEDKAVSGQCTNTLTFTARAGEV